MSIKSKTKTVLNITLYDENGAQLVGTIKGIVKLNGKTFMKITVNDGVLYTILDTQTQRVKNHTLTIKLGEGRLYNAQAFNISLEITKRDANMAVSTNTPSISGKLVVDVNVTDDGRPVDSGVVSFKINGKTLRDKNKKTITTKVEDGKAHFNYMLPSTIGSGKYKITTVYSDQYYNKADITDTFNVDKNTIGNITADKITTHKGSNTTINMTIKDAQGRAIYGKTKIAVKIDGATVLKNTYIYDGLLNVDLITDKTKVGNHNITVVLGENSRYLTGNVLIPLEIVE